jgi:membrane protein
MARSGRRFLGTLRRVFPDCQIAAQAVAFTMFLSFFPFLLLCLGLLSETRTGEGGLGEVLSRLRIILPPESARLVGAFLERHGTNAWRWISLGLGGTILVGMQVMSGLMEGFHIVEREQNRSGVLAKQFRAFVLLCLTIIPWVAVVFLTVFGRQARAWLIEMTGFSLLSRLIVAGCFFGVVLLLGVIVLMVIYRLGRPGRCSWDSVFPGAVLATVLWWSVDGLFGFYVRRVPYGEVYAGVAAAIGLMIWMYLTAIVVFLGAAYNAESRAG